MDFAWIWVTTRKSSSEFQEWNQQLHSEDIGSEKKKKSEIPVTSPKTKLSGPQNKVGVNKYNTSESFNKLNALACWICDYGHSIILSLYCPFFYETLQPKHSERFS